MMQCIIDMNCVHHPIHRGSPSDKPPANHIDTESGSTTKMGSVGDQTDWIAVLSIYRLHKTLAFRDMHRHNQKRRKTKKNPNSII